MDLAFFAHVFEEIPRAGVYKRLFVVAESMEEIEDRKTPRLIGVERRRKNNTIRNPSRQDFAGNGVALYPASGSEAARHGSEQRERKQKNEMREEAYS